MYVEKEHRNVCTNSSNYTFSLSEPSFEQNLDEPIESLGAKDTLAVLSRQPSAVNTEADEDVHNSLSAMEEATAEVEEMKEHQPEDCDGEIEEANNGTKVDGENSKPFELSTSLEALYETNTEGANAEQPPTSLRRRNRPE